MPAETDGPFDNTVLFNEKTGPLRLTLDERKRLGKGVTFWTKNERKEESRRASRDHSAWDTKLEIVDQILEELPIWKCRLSKDLPKRVKDHGRSMAGPG